MPKAKTHSGASKRFRRTGTGKIVRQKANRRHLLEHKPTKRTRRLDGRTEVSANDTKRVKAATERLTFAPGRWPPPAPQTIYA